MSRTAMTALAAAVVVALLTVVAIAVGTTRPAEPLALGLIADGPERLEPFAATAGAPAGIYGWYQDWAGRPAFDAARADAAGRAGALPMLTWEPWAPGAGLDQPAFALARIVAGDHDGYIASFARQVRDWGGVLALRVMHELDAPHYPWSVGVNGNTAADAVAAWRHIRAVFDAERADVVWVWCVNVHAAGTVPYDGLYPGDDAVDWLALDGYNGGTALPWGGWRSPEEVFGASLRDLRALGDRPVVLTEVGSAEEGGDKAAWIRDLFALAERERIRAVVWFDLAKEADWRITSSAASAAAFREGATAPGRTGPPPLPERLAEPGAPR